LSTIGYALLRSGLFGMLPSEDFDAMLEHVVSVEVAEGEDALREGDPADAFYVVVSGAFTVYTTAPDGSEVVLARLKPGDHFGEQALLGGGEGRRTASVRGAAPGSQMARLGVDRLEQLISYAPDLLNLLQTLGQRQLQERMARRTDLVRRLLAGVDTGATTRKFTNGHVLYRQGDPADAVYVVLSGQVALFEDRDGAQTQVARLGPGLCVGERDQGTRRSTAVIDGRTNLLEVRRDSLDAIRAGSREAQDHLATLERVWELPQRGFVTQFLGTVDDVPCLTQMFHLVDGRSFVSSHAIGSASVRLQASRGTPSRSVVTPDGDVRIGLGADGVILGIDANANRPALATLFSRAIEGRALSAFEEAALARTGELAVEDEGFACTCMRVPRARVRAAIADGVADLAGLKQRTGCGMSCGSCVPGLMEMLGQTSFFPVVIARRQVLTPEVIRFVLAGKGGEAPPGGKAGQHVVLRARIGDRLVDRPYTLSGAAGGLWEVTVKREKGGRFSTWLFDAGQQGATLECSAPRGSYVWDGGPSPVVCFVSGIGVTPALCFARTLLREGWPHRLVIDWSTRHESDAVLLGELAAATAPNLTIRRRITSGEGRIQPADVEAVAGRFPTAEFFLCGSDGYMKTVGAWLTAAGVPASRVHVESFDQSAQGGERAG
jgi:ferredoxin-NADP reductase/CRP-like cAMP-binding protein